MARSYYDAAVQVLQDADRPLKVGEIVEEAIRRGLIEPSGRSPVNTMSATLFRHTQGTEGPIQRVSKVTGGRGYLYALRT